MDLALTPEVEAHMEAAVYAAYNPDSPDAFYQLSPAYLQAYYRRAYFALRNSVCDANAGEIQQLAHSIWQALRPYARKAGNEARLANVIVTEWRGPGPDGPALTIYLPADNFLKLPSGVVASYLLNVKAERSEFSPDGELVDAVKLSPGFPKQEATRLGMKCLVAS